MSSTETTPAALVDLAHPEGIGRGIDCSQVAAVAVSAIDDKELQLIFDALLEAEAAEAQDGRSDTPVDEHALKQAIAYIRLRNLLVDHDGFHEARLAAVFEDLATSALCRAVA